MQSACAVSYCHLWPRWLYHIFQYYCINGTIFGKKMFLNLECIFWFFLQILPETFLILRRIQRDTVTNYTGLRIEYRLLLSDFDQILKSWTDFSKNPEISTVMKIRLMGDELMHTDRRTDMMKIIVASRNFSNTPKKETHMQALPMLLVAQLPRHD